MSQLPKQKGFDFYYRAKKEYEAAQKPFTYELNIFSTQPKPKKFMIIINKFIDVFKNGMKVEYFTQDQIKDNYWNQLQKYFGETYEMGYMINNSYEKKKNKLRLYFGLLIHTKQIFNNLETIVDKMSFMYQKPQQKKEELQNQLQMLSYLKDGQYHIMSQFINDFIKYEQERKQKQKLEEIQKKIQEIKQMQLKMKKQKQQAEKLEAERIKKLKQEQARKQWEKMHPNKNFQNEKPVQQTPKVDYFPSAYVSTQNTVNIGPRVYEKQALDTPQNLKNQHKKNSQILYEEKFKDQHDVFSFKLKPQFSENKQVCFECKKPLSVGLYFFGGNQNQCMYTGEWYCNEDTAEERISIPWKALQSFDLKGYTVSKKSYAQIKSYYQRAIIEIKNQSEVVKKSQILYNFLVLKRQIHLMYDSICDLELIQPLLKKRLNYCLKINLFSLKNLYDIYNGHESPSVQREYDILSKHFYRCERCQKRKGYVCGKCKNAVKIFAFQLKTTYGCKLCRKLYHRYCLSGNTCDCTQEQ